jgi:hypothetical protein
MKNDTEIIIECGVEGGSWTLVGIKAANGWRFRTIRNEAALFDDDPEADLRLLPATIEHVMKTYGWTREQTALLYGSFAPDGTYTPPPAATGPQEGEPTEYQREDWVHESDWVGSWGAALALFDEYPWHTFCPVRVHPDFAGEIWLAVQDRFDAAAHHKDDWASYNLKNWYRLSHGSGRASAYSDFWD